MRAGNGRTEKRGKMKKVRLSSRARRVFQGRSRGFTLIEVVIAIALLGMIGVAVLTALSTASMALIIADRRATAESLARTQMESIKNQGYIDYSESGHDDYDLIPTLEGYEIEPVGVLRLEVGLQKITVIVNYHIVGGENKMIDRQFTLEDYKRASVT